MVGTFALLYFGGLHAEHHDLRRPGAGHRHGRRRRDRRARERLPAHGARQGSVTAAIEGSEEVWGAIVASILTHIAVFVPLLFLTGISSILFKQLSVVVIFSLLMSLFVAVTLVPVLCAHLLKLPPPVEERRGSVESCSRASESFLDGMDDAYRRFLHKALAHRPIVIGVRRCVGRRGGA